MNEELSENVVLGTTAEEKNREVYKSPVLKKISTDWTAAAFGNGTDAGVYS